MREYAVVNVHWQELLSGVILFSAVSSQDQTIAQSPQFPPLNKPPVQVFLTASGKDGSPVLPVQSELSVSVDKKPAQVNALRSAKNDALLFAVLVDTSKSDADNAELIRRAALQFFQNLATSGNQGYLVLFSEGVAISKDPLQISQVQRALNTIKFDGGTAVYDAIEQTCTQKLSRLIDPDIRRRVILLISDGEDNASHITHDRAEEAAEKEGVAVFSLVTRSSLAGPRGGKFLKEVSHNTGGQAIIGKNLSEGVTLLLTALDEQWTLSFVPAQSPDHKLHSLDIRSSQKDVRVSSPAHILIR